MYQTLSSISCIALVVFVLISFFIKNEHIKKYERLIIFILSLIFASIMICRAIFE